MISCQHCGIEEQYTNEINKCQRIRTRTRTRTVQLQSRTPPSKNKQPKDMMVMMKTAMLMTGPYDSISVVVMITYWNASLCGINQM